MKIAVCVKAVPDAASGARHRSRRRSGSTAAASRALSEYDTHAIEEALGSRRRAGDGEVVVVSIGPGEGDGRAAQGARDGRRPRGARLATTRSPAPTSLGTAKALAGALERESADLVLFGQQSADGDGACLWAAVAERLRRPIVSQVSELTVDGRPLTGKRQTEFGYDTLARRCPPSSRSRDAINEPRYPSLKGIMGAKKKPQETLAADRRRAAADEPARRRCWRSIRRRRAARRAGSRTTARPREQIVEFLAERRLL